MAQKQYRLNLNAATFPVLVGQIGRTAFVRTESQSFIQLSYSAGEEDKKNVGIPQVLSVENCLPSSRGFQSVFPVTDIAAPTQLFNGKTTHSFNKPVFQAIPVVNATSKTRELYYFFHDNVDYAWKVPSYYIGLNPQNTLSTSYTAPNFWVTYAEIRGQTYIHIARHATYLPQYLKTGPDAYNFQLQELEGLETGLILGICQGVNYLIAYDDSTIYYSDPSSATYFVPSLGGAGSTRLLALRGSIVACYSIPDGFIIYTTDNAVAALYTGNAQQPFVFKEIPDCPGINHPRNVGWETSTGEHYVFTNRGLQVVTKNGAKSIFPEISDMLLYRKRQTLIFDIPDTYLVTNNMYVADEVDAQLSLAEAPVVQVAYVGARYVCISYTDNIAIHSPQADRVNEDYGKSYAFTACLVYDTALGRWGKLVTDHSCMMSHVAITSDTSPTWEAFTDTRDTWEFAVFQESIIQRGDAWVDYGTTTSYLSDVQSPINCITPWGAVTRWSADIKQLVRDPTAVAAWNNNVSFPDTVDSSNLFVLQPKIVIGRINLVTDRALSIYEILIEGKFTHVLPNPNYNYDPEDPTSRVFSRLQIEVFDFKDFPSKAAPFEFIPNTSQGVAENLRGERFSKKLRVTAFDPIIVISGCFNISSICVTVAPGGKR